MSKYLAFNEVVFKDRELLRRALEDLGCTNVQVGCDLPMGRYYSEQRAQGQRADVIVPRHAFGNSFGDIGFVRTEAGLTPVMDEYDRSRVLDGRFMARLRAAYNERAIQKVAERVRGTVHRRVEGGVTKIRVRF